MSTSPPIFKSISFSDNPPRPHPESKISPAPSKSHHPSDEDRRISPDTTTKLTRKDQLIEDSERRPSVQFATDQSEAQLGSESSRPKSRAEKSKAGRRISSPPPPPEHQARVSFDTFANPDVNTWSYSFRSDHKDYDYSSSGRTFLVGTDENDYSSYALEWLLEEMVDDNDIVICLRVVLKDPKTISTAEEKKYKTDAKEMLSSLQSSAGKRKIALILEFAAGKVQENIMRMIELYEPNFLVVGTRGRSLNGLQGLLPGSVSKWCIQNSPIPVVVARNESKRKKAKALRQADPNRRSYHTLLAATGGIGSTSTLLSSHSHGHSHGSLTPENGTPNNNNNNNNPIPNLDGSGSGGASTQNPPNTTNLRLLANSQTEAEAVARAIGIPTEYSASTILNRRSSRASASSAASIADSDTASEGLALRREISGRSEETEMESPSPTGLLEDEEYFEGEGGESGDDSRGGDGDGDGSGGGGGVNGMGVPEVRLERQASEAGLEGTRNL